MKQVLITMRPLIHAVCSLFFDRKYLSGRYFEAGLRGYIWAWRAIWLRSILRLGPQYPWPTGMSCHISNPKKMHFHPDDLNNFQSPGTYFQNFSADIYIGRGSYIGPNVGIITANHDLSSLDKHMDGRDVVIGPACWIGMNVVILPGVILGERTVIAAGSVVTTSFERGHGVLAGAPAKLIKDLAE